MSYDIINVNCVSVFTSLLNSFVNGHREERNTANAVLNIMQCCSIHNIHRRNDFSITGEKFYASDNLFLIKIKLFHINTKVENGINNERFVQLFADWQDNLTEVSLFARISTEDDESLYHDLYFYLNLNDFRFYGPFEDANLFNDGKAAVKPFGSPYGYINREFIFDISPQYEEAYPFLNGVAKVKLKNKYGFIDHYNNFLIQPEFDSASSFYYGFSVVGKLNKSITDLELYKYLDLKWNGKQKFATSFGLDLKIINLRGLAIPLELIQNTIVSIHRPKLNQFGEIFFDVFTSNDPDRSPYYEGSGIQIVYKEGTLQLSRTSCTNLIHYEIEFFLERPNSNRKVEFTESFFFMEIDPTFYDALSMDYLSYYNSKCDEMRDADNDAAADKYFKNPGLAFDEPDDYWNID